MVYFILLICYLRLACKNSILKKRSRKLKPRSKNKQLTFKLQCQKLLL